MYFLRIFAIFPKTLKRNDTCLKFSMASSTKSLQNDILSYESASDKKIVPEMYYIISLRIGDSEDGVVKQAEKCKNGSISLIKKLIKKSFGEDGTPLVAYSYGCTIYFLFSSLDISKQHFMDGSHHKICSFYASTLSREYDISVTCSIVELDTRTKVIVYFQTKVYENTRETIIKLMPKSEKIDENLSMFEMLEKLKAHSVVPKTKTTSPAKLSSTSKTSFSPAKQSQTLVPWSSSISVPKWDEIPKGERFGTFYKYVQSRDGKGKLSTLSELLDLRDLNKYMAYLFD